MRDLRRRRAERHDHLATGPVGDVEQHRAELPPMDVRLDAGEHDEIAIGSEVLGDVDDVLRPHDLSSDAVLEDDLRTQLLEVEEVVGLDVGEPRRAGVLDEPVDGTGRCRRRVEVAGERGDQHALTDFGLTFPDQIVHPPHPDAARVIP